MNRIAAVRDGNAYTLVMPDYIEHGTAVAVNGVFVDAKAQITVEGLPTVELFRRVTVKVRYVPLEDGLPVLSVDAHDREKMRLLAQRVTDGGVTRWPSLDVEFAHMKLERGYQLETRTEMVKMGDVEVLVTDKVPAEPFITPKRFLGGDYTSAVVVYDRKGFIVDYLTKELMALGLRASDSFDPTRFGQYKLYSNSEVSLFLPGTFHRTLQASTVTEQYAVVKRRQADDIALIDGWLTEWRYAYERPLNTVEIGEDVRRLRDAILRIDAKVVSADAKRAALRAADQILDKLRPHQDGPRAAA